MSGGVDSSVAAAFAGKTGYEVIGVFLNHGVIAQISNTCIGGKIARSIEWLQNWA